MFYSTTELYHTLPLYPTLLLYYSILPLYCTLFLLYCVLLCSRPGHAGPDADSQMFSTRCVGARGDNGPSETQPHAPKQMDQETPVLEVRILQYCTIYIL